jgi:hypothetical protein
MNFVEAETSYDKANISLSHSFIIDEALSFELSGYFYLSTGMTVKALDPFFTSVVDRYSSWGAKTKANTLSDFIREQSENFPTSLLSCMGAEP